MKKIIDFNPKKKEACSCQCHFQSPLYYLIDCCCCPFLYHPHESSSNIISNSFRAIESPRMLIPQKEKAFYIKSEQRNPASKLSKEFNNKIPFIRNKMNNILSSKSNTDEIVCDSDKRNAKNIINKENIDDLNDNKKLLFKKIKVNKNNQKRICTIQTSHPSSQKNTIDINHFFPNSVKRSKKVKQFNDYDFNINKKILVNKNLNLTNISPRNQNTGLVFNPIVRNKLTIRDKNDDIMDIKQEQYSSETNDNRKILQNLKKEIDKTKNMINNLKSENKKLKNKINQKGQDNTKDEQKEGIENVYINKNKEINLEKEVIYMKNEIKEVSNKLIEYENIIALLKKRNSELETIIENKDKEILNLIIKLGNFEKSIKDNKEIQERINISNDEYKHMNNDLKMEILQLKQISEERDNKIKELEIKLKFEKNFNNKKQKMLEILFNFYQNLKRVINYDTPKESLKNIIDIITIDDFKLKLDKFEKKITQIIEDMQIKHGHCFACDIACCTSSVDKLKYFRKKNPKKK